MGLICEFAVRVRDQPIANGERGRIGKLLKAHQPGVVLYGIAQTMDWANEPEKWLNYATRVIEKTEKAGVP